MGNTPCAHAVDSVLHQRVEIKAESSPSDHNLLVLPIGKLCSAAYTVF